MDPLTLKETLHVEKTKNLKFAWEMDIKYTLFFSK